MEDHTEKPRVGFDESGNTGQNLLDPAQPVFVLASTLLAPDQLGELRSTLGINTAAELHFVQLKRSKRNWERVLQAANLPWIGETTVKAVVYHKRFMIITKIVDMLVEDLLHRAGIDLYVQGRNIGLSNLWYHVMPVFCDSACFDGVLQAFVSMVRDPSEQSINAFYSAVWTLRRRSTHKNFRQADLSLLLRTQEVVADAVYPKDTTAVDPAVPAFVHAAVRWDEELDRPFEILHDASKPVEHAREIMECFMAKDEPRVLSGYDRRKARFPLRVDSLTLVESRDEPMVQAADFFAGCVAHAFRGIADTRLRDELAAGLAGSKLMELDHGVIWPSTAVTPEELGTEEIGGINPADYAAELIARQQAKAQVAKDSS